MTGIPIPPPQEPLKPADSDRANDIWYRYWDGQSRSINDLTTSVAALSSAISAITTVSTSGTINSGTVLATTGGTQITFTGIPANVNRLTVSFDSIGLTSAGSPLIQIGTSSALVATGYNSNSIRATSAVTLSTASTIGFVVLTQNSAPVLNGHMTMTRITSHTWVQSHHGALTTIGGIVGGGRVALGGELERVSILTNDTANNAFRSGQANIHWEF